MADAAADTGRVLWRGSVDGLRRLRRSRPGEILRVLPRARIARALYGPDHPVAADAIQELSRVIEHLLGPRPSVRLSIRHDTFFVENAALLDESLQFSAFLTELTERGIGSLEFTAGIEPWELATLVGLLTLPLADLEQLGGAAAQIEQHNVRHVVVGPVRASSHDGEPEAEVDPRDAYRAGLRVVNELNYQALAGLPLDLKKARLVVNSLIDIVLHDKVAMLGFSALKHYDEETCHHSVNVSVLCLLLGLELHLDRVLAVTLGMAALLHDIGKIRIPREIVAKPARLTPAEQEIMRRHTLHGAHLLRNLPGLARLATVVAFEHHANYDLSGYPRVIGKQGPHLLSRIVQVTDFYDAATSLQRRYQRRMLPHDAVAFVAADAGRMFDPALAALFVRVVGLYPVGSVVELDTGDIAVVVRPPERDPARPMVRLVASRTGERTVPPLLDLAHYEDRRIVRAHDPADVGVDVPAYLGGPALSRAPSPELSPSP